MVYRFIISANEIAYLCNTLSLGEKEGQAQVFDGALKNKRSQRLTLCLVGKILTTKLIDNSVFIDVFPKVWQVEGGVEIEPAKGNIFIFYFKNAEEKARILMGGPWHFDRAIIILEEPMGEETFGLKRECGRFDSSEACMDTEIDCNVGSDKDNDGNIADCSQLVLKSSRDVNPIFKNRHGSENTISKNKELVNLVVGQNGGGGPNKGKNSTVGNGRSEAKRTGITEGAGLNNEDVHIIGEAKFVDIDEYGIQESVSMNEALNAADNVNHDWVQDKNQDRMVVGSLNKSRYLMRETTILKQQEVTMMGQEMQVIMLMKQRYRHFSVVKHLDFRGSDYRAILVDIANQAYYLARKASVKRSRNLIHGLRDEYGLWRTEKAKIESIISRYFDCLFQSFSPSIELIDSVTGGVIHTLSDRSRMLIDREFTASEVHKAIFDMALTKAYGMDRLPAIFYQMYWDTIGNGVTRFGLSCLNDGESMDLVNKTLITLIPKS
ncbi:hypothetical protein Ddye_022942 [Dipteronia dyeriana]|uniref:DUF4283 domain-containing protein n=1 Tax=Dipteronia dyeriana TaxID=168575 RepID=A0AAD9TSX9_9ROSI|nr:hypothetical protein Ddye_022942 [Dipteronia dyeriana]